MDFTMQQLEDMNELDRLYLFEDIPEEDLKAHLASLPEDEQVALLTLIPEEIRCDMGYLSDQEMAYSKVSVRYARGPAELSDFGGFSGRYGQKYKDWLEAYCPEEFWELVFKKELGAVCKAKNEEVADFIDDTVKALLANNPAPNQNTHFLEHVGHMNALQAQAEEMAEPLMFGGCQRGELGIPKLERPVATRGRGKNMFFNGTQEDWEDFDRVADEDVLKEFF